MIFECFDRLAFLLFGVIVEEKSLDDTDVFLSCNMVKIVLLLSIDLSNTSIITEKKTFNFAHR